MPLFKRSDRVFLSMSGDCAQWSRWRNGELVDEFLEPLPTATSDSLPSESVSGSSQHSASARVTACPWITGSGSGQHLLQVQLIVDSALSEVLRVETASLVSGSEKFSIAATVQERRLLNRLHSNHPDATIARMRGTSALDAAWLSRERWPQRWIAWLASLQSAGVLFTHVLPSVQLLSRYLPSTSSDALLVLIGSRQQQHVLLREGVVVFRRVIAVDGDDSIRTALTDSLNHLQSRLQTTSVSLCSQGMSDALCDEWRVNASVSDVVVMMPGVDESPLDDECTEPVHQDAQIARLLTRLAAQATPRSERSPSAGPVFDVLKQRNSHDRMRRLSAATALSVLIASVTVAFALVEGFNSIREGSHRRQEQTRLAETIEQFDQASRRIHPQARTAEQLLIHIESVEHDRSQSAPALMELLATVLKDFPSVGLDRLKWRTELADLEQSTPLLVVTADAWPDHSVSGEASEPTLVLELSGNVDASRSLRERQQRFDSFVAALVEVDAISEVEVLLSPLAQAASAERVVKQGGQADYQVRVNLHER